jgi:prepilin-type N-terminal cleavage/methylation domain-containing protein
MGRPQPLTRSLPVMRLLSSSLSQTPADGRVPAASTVARSVRASGVRPQASVYALSATRAFTLIEVILALVVLGAALAIFGEVMHVANRSAAAARAHTQAELLASSLMDEILAGVVDDSPATRQPLNVVDDAAWVYSVTLGTTNIRGVVPLEVVVEQDLEPQLNPVKFRLVRWVSTLEASSESDDQSGSGQQGTGPGDSSSGGAGGAGSTSGAGTAGRAGGAGAAQ